jgi:hypothetical protein
VSADLAELERRVAALEAALTAAYAYAGLFSEPARGAGRETVAQQRRERIERSGLSLVGGGDAS